MLVGIAQPGAVKLVACRVSFVTLVAPARFPAAHAGAIARFCVGEIPRTHTGVGAVAIGVTEHPFVLARVCTAIFAIAIPVLNQATANFCNVRLNSLLSPWHCTVRTLVRSMLRTPRMDFASMMILL